MCVWTVELDSQGAWEASLKIQDSHPLRSYRDTGHGLATQRAYPGWALLRAEIPGSGKLILRAHVIEQLNGRAPTDQHHLVRPGIVIDRERNPGVCGERRELGG